MAERYKITFELSGGTVLTIDSPARIEGFHCRKESSEGVEGTGVSLEAEANEALKKYRLWRTNKSPGRLPQATTFSESGVELQVVACYISGMKMRKTLDYLRKRHGVIASHSSLGRVFRDLFNLKIQRSPRPIEVTI